MYLYNIMWKYDIDYIVALLTILVVFSTIVKVYSNKLP